MKEKLANGVGSQYSSHYIGTWCILHFEIVDNMIMNSYFLCFIYCTHSCSLFNNAVGRVQLKCDGTRRRTGGEVKEKLAN